MGRRHPVTHVQHIDAYTEKYEPASEYLIEEIIGHKTTKRRVKYRVRWSDGSETWEPKESLIDRIETEDEPVINDALVAYWSTREQLRQGEGY